MVIFYQTITVLQTFWSNPITSQPKLSSHRFDCFYDLSLVPAQTSQLTTAEEPKPACVEDSVSHASSISSSFDATRSPMTMTSRHSFYDQFI